MREIHGHAGAVMEGDPRAVFAAITDIERLREWNPTASVPAGRRGLLEHRPQPDTEVTQKLMGPPT